MAEQELVEEITEDEVKVVEDGYVESDDLELSETDEPDETDKDEEVAEKKPWDDDDSDESDDSVPLTALLKTKRKLKGQIGERDTEIEELKGKLKTLESTIQVPQAEQPTKRPRVSDFETDEEYEDALDVWDEQKFNNISQTLTQKNTQDVQAERELKRIRQAHDNHYERAELFVKEQSIEPAVYEAADSNVRNAVEAIRPQQGNQTVDYLISKLGEDSEKIMLCLGNNKKNLKEFQGLLEDDPSGLTAMKMIGRIERDLKPNKKLTSKARKPAANVSGGKVSSTKGRAEKKLFDAAEKSGKNQEAYKIRKAAKAAGHNVKDWS